jgi:predicted small secreted protein
MDRPLHPHWTRPLGAFLALLALVSLAGCNTVRGVGIDIYETASSTKAFLDDTFQTGYTPGSSPTADAGALSIRDDYNRYRRP